MTELWMSMSQRKGTGSTGEGVGEEEPGLWVVAGAEGEVSARGGGPGGRALTSESCSRSGGVGMERQWGGGVAGGSTGSGRGTQVWRERVPAVDGVAEWAPSAGRTRGPRNHEPRHW